MAVCYGVVILIAVGLYNIIARILLLKTVLIWRGVRVSDGAAGGRSEGQGLVFFLSTLQPLANCLGIRNQI